MKTRDPIELLKKYRKGATAGFNALDWKTVCEAVGWKALSKPGELRITIPAGATMVITKEPGYRCLVFYDFIRWAKANALDQFVEAKLGPPPPKVETRDLTNTGTCPACFGNFKLDAKPCDLIDKTTGKPTGDKFIRKSICFHGYKRPGDGQTRGRCFGCGYKPYELSAKGTIDYRARVEQHLVLIDKSIAHFKTEPEEILIGSVLARGTTLRAVKKGDLDYKGHLEARLNKLDWERIHVLADLSFLASKIVDWKLQPLPGVSQ